MDLNQKNPDELRKARNYALRLLKVRLRSKEELKGRLKQKGYSSSVIEAVIEELKNSKLLDDERFATFFASDQIEFHVKGPRYIKYKLKMFGVDDFIIESALKRVFEDADLKKVFSRFVRNHRSKSEEEVTKMLIKRGFDLQTVHQTLLKIYEEWRCEDESGNDAHFDIRSDRRPGSDTGLSSREDKGTQRAKKGEGKRQ